MIPRRHNLVLCIVAATAIAWCSMLTAEGLPIDRLMLSSALSSVVYHRYRRASPIPLPLYAGPQGETGPDEPLAFAPQPSSHGRAQIRSILQREQQQQQQAQQQARDNTSHEDGLVNPYDDQDDNDNDNDDRLLKHVSNSNPNLLHSSVVSQSDEQTSFIPSESLPPSPQHPILSSSSLEGHAVLDDDDDDAGNELLDTEADGFVPPDADDEFEGEMESEAYEEEEDDEDDDEANHQNNGLEEEEENIEGELGYEETLALLDRIGVVDHTIDLDESLRKGDRGAAHHIPPFPKRDHDDSKDDWSSVGAPETEEDERVWTGVIQRLQAAIHGMPKGPNRVQGYQEQDHTTSKGHLDRSSSLLAARLRSWQASADESMLVEKGYHDGDLE